METKLSRRPAGYWKDVLRKSTFIYTNGDLSKNARDIRKAIAELSKTEERIFIPVKEGSHLYILIETADQQQIEAYYRSQIKHTKSHYRNKLKPIKKYLRDETLKRIMGQLEVMEELSNDFNKKVSTQYEKAKKAS